MKQIGKSQFRYWIIAVFIFLIILTIYMNVWITNEGFDNNNIIGYIHVCQKDGWKKSYDMLIKDIKASGLYDNTKEIRIGIVNDDGIKIEDDRFLDDKIQIIYVGKSAEYERPTLLHMKASTEKDSHGTLYYYLHTKGIQHFNTKNEPYVIKWINSMLDINIKNWRNAVDKLKTYETYGCHYNKVHYSGNFWWATKAHIEKLSDNIPDYYTAPEDWILTNKDGLYCDFNCGDEFKPPFPDWFYQK